MLVTLVLEGQEGRLILVTKIDSEWTDIEGLPESIEPHPPRAADRCLCADRVQWNLFSLEKLH